MTEAEILQALKDTAEECYASSRCNGEYNTAFYVVHVVLHSLIRKIETGRQALGGG